MERLEIIFDVLNVGLAYIPILSAAKVFLPDKKDNFHACICLVENFVFRVLTIGHMDTAELERKLGEAARRLFENKKVEGFEKYLKDQADDINFKSNFANHIERRSKIQYYILSELEKFLLGGGKGVVPGDHHSAKNHVEHILPKRLSNAAGRTHEWNWARANPERHQNFVNRLGNMLVLESDINKAVGNHEYDVKRNGEYKKNKSGNIKHINCYSKSALKWPKMLCDSSEWPTWGESAIEKRQKEMAEDALQIWAL